MFFDRTSCWERFDIFYFTQGDDGAGGVIENTPFYVARSILGRSTKLTAEKLLKEFGYAGIQAWGIYCDTVSTLTADRDEYFLRVSPTIRSINLDNNSIYKIIKSRVIPNEYNLPDHSCIYVELDQSRSV